MKKILLGILITLGVVVGGAAVFLITKKPAQRPPSAAPVVADAAMVARGNYLVHNVFACLDCHSDRHWDRYGLPPKEDTWGSGSDFCWDDSTGSKGFKLCAKNITPDAETGLATWTDGEIMRAIREGVDRDGNALFPVMPYEAYREMSEDDVRAVVAYLRTMKPIHRVEPERVLPGPLPIIVKFMPTPIEADVVEPDRKSPVALGRYLTTVAACVVCHTPVNKKHQPLPGKQFAGGREFTIPGGGKVFSANLTPHETGMGARTEAEFIALFRSFQNEEVRTTVIARAQNTVMPWQTYSGMTDGDLAAIYAYLKTVPGLANQVEKRPKPAAVAPGPPPVGGNDAGGTVVGDAATGTDGR